MAARRGPGSPSRRAQEDQLLQNFDADSRLRFIIMGWLRSLVRGEPYVIYYAPIDSAIGREQAKLQEKVLETLAVKETDPSRKGKFNRILGVDFESGTVIFPAGDPPRLGSSVYGKPAILKEAIRATHESGIVSFGSGIALSPHFFLTSARVTKSCTRCLNGDFVRPEHFDMADKPRYNLKNISRDEGCDFALMRATTSSSAGILWTLRRRQKSQSCSDHSSTSCCRAPPWTRSRAA
ncbi:hypothetical protein SELMODRAFT_420154 [Selaginella moellendorffii]|uniref:Uncharacterized protein n=1 Tax=Selaginella moellendorffii TaxID=88036 RepID=D8SB49_SELML|nr:hypothetical protein SELMODRAFT_420154 [Selaginella moellendorffii]